MQRFEFPIHYRSPHSLRIEDRDAVQKTRLVVFSFSMQKKYFQFLFITCYQWFNDEFNPYINGNINNYVIWRILVARMIIFYKFIQNKLPHSFWHQKEFLICEKCKDVFMCWEISLNVKTTSYNTAKYYYTKPTREKKWNISNDRNKTLKGKLRELLSDITNFSRSRSSADIQVKWKTWLLSLI